MAANGEGAESPNGSDVVIVDVPERSRYEARIRGHEATGAAHYRLKGDAIVFTHTEVPKELEGRGIGGALARFALEEARRRGLAVHPQCPFISTFIRRHPGFASLVPAEARERFGIPAGGEVGRRGP